MIVIADTTPLNYLVLIGGVDILPELYGRILIPLAVWKEFQRPETLPPCALGLPTLHLGSKFGQSRKIPTQYSKTLAQESVKPSLWPKNFVPTDSLWMTALAAASQCSGI